MPLRKRRREWLEAVTREKSIRGIARAVGRTHPTVSRWIENGIPLDVLLDISVRLHLDPYAAVDAIGLLENADGQPRDPALSLVPTVRLIEELHRRATEGLC